MNELIRGTLDKSIEWKSRGLSIASPDHAQHGLMSLAKNVEEISQLDYTCILCGKKLKVSIYGNEFVDLYIENKKRLSSNMEFLSYYITNPLNSLRGCLLEIATSENPYSMHIQDFLKELKNR